MRRSARSPRASTCSAVERAARFSFTTAPSASRTTTRSLSVSKSSSVNARASTASRVRASTMRSSCLTFSRSVASQRSRALRMLMKAQVPSSTADDDPRTMWSV